MARVPGWRGSLQPGIDVRGDRSLDQLALARIEVTAELGVRRHVGRLRVRDEVAAAIGVADRCAAGLVAPEALLHQPAPVVVIAGSHPEADQIAGLLSVREAVVTPVEAVAECGPGHLRAAQCGVHVAAGAPRLSERVGALIACVVVAQGTVADGYRNVVTIDSFIATTATLVIVVPQNPSFPLTLTRSTSSSDIFGGERDLRLVAQSGTTSLVLSTGVDAGQYFASTPEGASGSALIQYDGPDNSIGLKPGGLFGQVFTNDLTREGVFAFHLVIGSDIATTLLLKVYSGSGSDYCSRIIPVPGDDQNHDYYINFSEFTVAGAGCDFTNVGAIELLTNMFTDVDVIITLFATYGPVPATPTRSKTPTPSPTYPPTLTRTPSPTPTPSGDICACICPQFRCALFRYDDTDYVPGKEAEVTFFDALLTDFVAPLLGLN